MNLIELTAKVVPLLRNRTTNKYDFIRDVETYWNEHQNRVVENWYLYLGYHNLFFTPFEGESQSDFIRRVENAVIENHIQPIIDTICMYLYGKEVVRYVKRNDVVDEKLMNILRKRIWAFNGGIYDDIKAINTLVTGYTLIQRAFFDFRTGHPFTPADSAVDKVKYGYVKKIPLDSMSAIPLPYITEDGRVLYDRFGGVIIYATFDNLIGNNDIMTLLGTEYQNKSIIEYIDDNNWIRFSKIEGEDWVHEFSIENPYGKIDILFSLYKNTGDPFSVEGESEVTKLKRLNIDLNELSDGDRNVIRSHQYPILLGKGGATLPNNFIRTKDAVIDGIEGNGTFEYLTWTGNLEESRLRQEALRKVMGYVSGISNITRGIIDNLGQIRSGSPLKALLSSDRITHLRKSKIFESFERAEMLADLLFYSKNTNLNLDITPDVEFYADFDPDFLELNELINEEINAMRVNVGAADIETILREEHPEWTEEELQDALSRIKEFKGKISTNVKSKSIRQSVEKANLKQYER